MTEAVLSINIDESAGEVLRLFAGNPIHQLPVLNGQKVVGMPSSADVMKLDAFRPKTIVPTDEYLNQRVSVALLLRRPVITIQPHQSLIDAASLMAIHGIHALPVVDAEDGLLGIITTTDIMQAALPRPPPAGVASPVSGGVPSCDIRISEAAFEQAIAAAKIAVGAAQDPQGIAMVLLYLQKRLVGLEHVLQISDRYLCAGQEQALHAALLKAIAEAKGSTPSHGLDV